MTRSKAGQAFIEAYRGLPPKAAALYKAVDVPKLSLLGFPGVAAKGNAIPAQVTVIQDAMKKAIAENGGHLPSDLVLESLAIFESCFDELTQSLTLLRERHAERALGIGMGLPRVTISTLTNGHAVIKTFAKEVDGVVQSEEQRRKLAGMFGQILDEYQKAGLAFGGMVGE